MIRKNGGMVFDDAVEMDGFPQAAAGPKQPPQSSVKVRTEFPETWLWSEAMAG